MAKTIEDRRLQRYLVWFPEQHLQLIKDRPCIIGRVPECDIRVPSSSVSRNHAAIRWTDVGVELRDLGSTNGTFVNGDRVSRCMLNSDDEIRIGGREITFLLTSGVDSGQSFARARQMQQSHLTQTLDVDEMTRRPGGFAGSLEDVGVPELVQVMQLTKKSGVIRVYIGRREARLWLNGGEVISASFDELEGDEAFYKVFPHRVGLFEFRPLEFVDRPPTISMPTPSLLVAAFQRTPPDFVPEVEQETSEVPPQEPEPTPSPAAARAAHELTVDTGRFDPVDDKEEDVSTRETPHGSMADGLAAVIAEMAGDIGVEDMLGEIEADGDDDDNTEAMDEVSDTGVNLAMAAKAAYVQSILEMIVSPLLFEHQQDLTHYVVRSQMNAGSIRVIMYGGSASSSSTGSWLLIGVENDHVNIQSDMDVSARVEGRPDPMDLKPTIETAMNDFIQAVVRAGAADLERSAPSEPDTGSEDESEAEPE